MASLTAKDIINELAEVNQLFAGSTANRLRLRDSMAMSLAAKINRLKSFSVRDGIEIGAALTAAKELPPEIFHAVEQSIDARLAQDVDTSPAKNLAGYTKPQLLTNICSYLTKADWEALEDPRKAMPSRKQIIMHRLNKLGIRSLDPKTVRAALSIVMLLTYKNGEWPNSWSLYEEVQEFSRIFSSMKTAWHCQAQAPTTYPDDPHALPREVFDYAYDATDPPVPMSFPGLSAVADKVPLRNTSRLLRKTSWRDDDWRSWTPRQHCDYQAPTAVSSAAAGTLVHVPIDDRIIPEQPPPGLLTLQDRSDIMQSDAAHTEAAANHSSMLDSGQRNEATAFPTEDDSESVRSAGYKGREKIAESTVAIRPSIRSHTASIDKSCNQSPLTANEVAFPSRLGIDYGELGNDLHETNGSKSRTTVKDIEDAAITALQNRNKSRQALKRPAAAIKRPAAAEVHADEHAGKKSKGNGKGNTKAENDQPVAAKSHKKPKENKTATDHENAVAAKSNKTTKENKTATDHENAVAAKSNKTTKEERKETDHENAVAAKSKEKPTRKTKVHEKVAAPKKGKSKGTGKEKEKEKGKGRGKGTVRVKMEPSESPKKGKGNKRKQWPSEVSKPLWLRRLIHSVKWDSKFEGKRKGWLSKWYHKFEKVAEQEEEFANGKVTIKDIARVGHERASAVWSTIHDEGDDVD